LVITPAYVLPVNRSRIIVLALTALAIPAAAYSAFTLDPHQEACFVSDSASYRIAPDAAAPDFRIAIAGDEARADLRMQLVDRPEIADFVLVDGPTDDRTGEDISNCQPSARTVTVEASGPTRPDVTVALTGDPDAADYRLYVRSTRFSQRDAMALVAALWKSSERRQVAAAQPVR
jgi:hypothetical protein